MNLFLVSLYVILITVGFVSLVVAHKLYKTYRLSYLQIFVYFLILLNAFGFLKIVGRFFLYHLFDGIFDSGEVYAGIDAAVTFIAYPFLVLSSYLFYAAFRNWVKQPVTRLFKWIYFSAELVILVLVFMEMYRFIQFPALSHRMPLLMMLFIASTAAVEFLAAWQLIRYRKTAPQPALRRFLMRVGVYYLSVLTVFYVMKLGFWGRFVASVGYPIFYYSMHLLPLLWIRSFLSTFIVAQPLYAVEDELLEEIFKQHEISPREQDIIRLMLEDKSNAEIGEVLFISIKTVRNHIYSIYQKIGVKTRLEMTNRLRNVQHVA